MPDLILAISKSLKMRFSEKMHIRQLLSSYVYFCWVTIKERWLQKQKSALLSHEF